MCKTKEKEIVIVLTNTGTVLSKAIKRYTKEPYSHVSLSFDRNLNKMYSFGRLNPKNPLVGGFVIESMNSGFHTIFKEIDCAIYTLNVDYTQYSNILKKINEFKETKNEYKYNFLGLFAVALNKEYKRKNAYFCSQFVATVLKLSGVDIFDKKCGLVTPSDFRQCKNLRLIYSGNFEEYKLNNYGYKKAN